MRVEAGGLKRCRFAASPSERSRPIDQRSPQDIQYNPEPGATEHPAPRPPEGRVLCASVLRDASPP